MSLEDEKILKNTFLFAKLGDAQFAELMSHIKEETVNGGITFIHEGEKADALYIIKEGVLQVFTTAANQEKIVLARLEKGGFFGEQALLTSTPGLRNASVRTITDSILLKVSHEMFLRVIEGDDALKEALLKIGFQQLFTKLHALESEYPMATYLFDEDNNEVLQYIGRFLHMPAIISKFQLKGREIISYYVIGKNIQSIRESYKQNPQTYTYESRGIHRELHLIDDQLVGVDVYGEWAALRELYSRVFKERGITKEELACFTQHGELTFDEIVPQDNENEIVCDCMYVSKDEIFACIRAGLTSFDELADMLGVGRVCGACTPNIESMLGHDAWQAMHILKVIILTPDVRAYRFIPVQNKPLRPFSAGQHVVIQCEINGKWVERSYTLTSAPGNREYYEIAIKREDKGLLSRWLFDNERMVPFIRVSHPMGDVTLDVTKSNLMVCLTAGIGITPAVAFARALNELQAPPYLFIYVTERNNKELVYNTELEALSAKRPQIKYIKHLTEDKGRMTSEQIMQIAKKYPNADFFICGPLEFEFMVRKALQKVGIKENKIIVERFVHANR